MPGQPLKLFNSLTRRLETFEPVHPGEARVYSCGPTVYNYPHIGNMRAYVFADVLGRTLSWKGYALSHVINITDVGHLTDDADAGEDKLEKAAAAQKQSIWDIAKHYTEAYWADVKALNIRQPAQWSVATDYIEPMLDFAKRIAPEHCYEIDEGLYFDVTTIEDYAKLAGRTKLDQLREDEEAYIRIDAVSGKRNAADFAIWRKTPAGETRQMEWDSPWGRGAPGWHLECSVMGGKLLGFPFDIHTGGIDHREIHHPNEIAQNQAFCCTDGLDDPLNSGARIWMHNNFLVERSGKMSKSAGEFLRLPLLVEKGYHPLAYRLMCLQAHYRSELEFSWENLAAAARRFQRLVIAARRTRPDSKFFAQLKRDFPQLTPVDSGVREDYLRTASPRLQRYLDRFESAISDDLNTAEALVVLEQMMKDKGLKKRSRASGMALIDEVLGLGLITLSRRVVRLPADRVKTPVPLVNADIDAAVRIRRKLKEAGEYDLADQIRRALADWGVEVMDGDPLGWEWKL